MELTASSGKLVFRADAAQWCRVELTIGDRVLQLGADSFTVVVERLLQGLRDDDQRPQAGVIDGLQVAWVLSLAERHASIYSAHDGGLLVLLFQDADGCSIARLELDYEERRRWIATLETETLRASTRR